MDEYGTVIHKDNNPSIVDISEGSFDSIKDIFKDEKGGKTIDKELEEFKSLSGNEKEEVNEEIEDSGGFGLDDLGEGGEILEEVEEEVEEEDELEDYFESAEFIIFILELAIVFGTNFYLKQKGLDKIGIEEFDKTARQQKSLVKSWAKVLRKHKTKVSPEVELLFNMGASYGIKIQGIVKRQEERKLLEIEKNSKKKPRGKVIPIKQKKSEPVSNEVEEEVEKKVEKKDTPPNEKVKKLKGTSWGLDTSKAIKRSDLI